VPRLQETLARGGLLRLLTCEVMPNGRCHWCGEEIAGFGWQWKKDNNSKHIERKQ
jgi:hypothetical protein